MDRPSPLLVCGIGSPSVHHERPSAHGCATNSSNITSKNQDIIFIQCYDDFTVCC
jgi:hypothetical protein